MVSNCITFQKLVMGSSNSHLLFVFLFQFKVIKIFQLFEKFMLLLLLTNLKLLVELTKEIYQGYSKIIQLFNNSLKIDKIIHLKY